MADEFLEDDDAIEEVDLDQEELDEEELEDRGDDFVPTGDDDEDEEEVEEDDDTDTPDDGSDDQEREEDPEEESDDDEKEEDPEEDKSTPDSIPVGRVNKMVHEKNASVAIGDAIVEGTLAPAHVKELGGVKAVAKAIANGDITLEELEGGQSPVDDEEVDAGETSQVEPNGTVDGLLAEIKALDLQRMEASEDGDFEEAVEIGAKIDVLNRKIIRAEDKAELEASQAKDAETEANSIFAGIFEDHPELNDEKTEEYQDFKMFFNRYEKSGMTPAEALTKASSRVFGDEPTGDVEDELDPDEVEEKKLTVAERKKEHIIRKAKAAGQQPPRLEKGVGQKKALEKMDVAELTDEEYDALPEKTKARLRGDTV